MPLLNGIEVARNLTATNPKAKILFVTMRTERIYVQEAFRAGCAGYVLKQSAGDELVTAIRTVLDGQRYLSPVISEKTDVRFESENPENVFAPDLTPRQREVLQLVAEGKSMKEIAQILKVSIRTVEFHKTRITESLGIRTTAELTRYALDHKLTGA
jgi:DNA-binding NarL/FixJ family response regulator